MSGVEILGLAASVIQLADVGLRLSVKLFTFTRKIKSAEREIDALSHEIAATGAVLQQLGSALSEKRCGQLCSPQAVTTAKGLVEDCERVFQKLEKAIGSDQSGKKAKVGVVQRFRFTFLESHIEELRANLERLKSSLLVILQVLVLAEQLRNQEALPILKDTRQLLDSLLLENVENEKRYNNIVRLIEDAGNDSNNSGNPTQHAASPSPFRSFMAISKDLPPVKATRQDDLPPGLDRHHDRIHDHSLLVTNLLQEVGSTRYKLDYAHRLGLHNGILDIHWNAWAHMRSKFGLHVFLKIFAGFEDVARHWSDQHVPGRDVIAAQPKIHSFETPRTTSSPAENVSVPTIEERAPLDYQATPFGMYDHSWASYTAVSAHYPPARSGSRTSEQPFGGYSQTESSVLKLPPARQLMTSNGYEYVVAAENDEATSLSRPQQHETFVPNAGTSGSMNLDKVPLSLAIFGNPSQGLENLSERQNPHSKEVSNPEMLHSTVRRSYRRSSTFENQSSRNQEPAYVNIPVPRTDQTTKHTTIPLQVRRKRASKPKAKTGCKTCKIRHVKCDETRPFCRRCASSGRSCEGYDEPQNPRIDIDDMLGAMKYSQRRHEPNQAHASRSSVTEDDSAQKITAPDTPGPDAGSDTSVQADTVDVDKILQLREYKISQLHEFAKGFRLSSIARNYGRSTSRSPSPIMASDTLSGFHGYTLVDETVLASAINKEHSNDETRATQSPNTNTQDYSNQHDLKSSLKPSPADYIMCSPSSDQQDDRAMPLKKGEDSALILSAEHDSEGVAASVFDKTKGSAARASEFSEIASDSTSNFVRGHRELTPKESGVSDQSMFEQLSDEEGLTLDMGEDVSVNLSDESTKEEDLNGIDFSDEVMDKGEEKRNATPCHLPPSGDGMKVGEDALLPHKKVAGFVPLPPKSVYERYQRDDTRDDLAHKRDHINSGVLADPERSISKAGFFEGPNEMVRSRPIAFQRVSLARERKESNDGEADTARQNRIANREQEIGRQLELRRELERRQEPERWREEREAKIARQDQQLKKERWVGRRSRNYESLWQTKPYLGVSRTNRPSGGDNMLAASNVSGMSAHTNSHGQENQKSEQSNEKNEVLATAPALTMHSEDKLTALQASDKSKRKRRRRKPVLSNQQSQATPSVRKDTKREPAPESESTHEIFEASCIDDKNPTSIFGNDIAELLRQFSNLSESEVRALASV